MRFLLLALAVLITSVLLALMAREDPGYILVTRGDWALESSLTLALVALILGFVLLYAVLRGAVRTWHLPRRARHWRTHRRARRARLASQKGLLELAEGSWAKAERHLTRYADDSDVPLLNYLGAARAAQKQHAERRRDHYLSMAHNSMPEAELAVGLTQAEVQVSHGQFEQALATLRHLRSIAPKHHHVLYLLKRLYEKLESWNDLAELLPDLRKQGVLEPAELEAAERRVYTRLLANAARSGKAERIDEVWGRIPKARRRDSRIAAIYAEQLIQQKRGADAETLLRDVLKREWEPKLVYLYGLAEGEDATRQLAHAETWLRNHERQPDLLLTLGRIALRGGLFGKARAYLEASLGVEKRPESYRDLGMLLERMNEPERAAECFRKGLEAAVPPPLSIPRLPRPERPAQSLAHSNASE